MSHEPKPIQVKQVTVTVEILLAKTLRMARPAEGILSGKVALPSVLAGIHPYSVLKMHWN